MAQRMWAPSASHGPPFGWLWRRTTGRPPTRHDLQLRLTLDDALGGHDAVSWYRLAQETKEAMELLAPALAVGSRYLKLTRKPREADRTDLQINASWMDLHLSVGTGAETAAKTAQMRVEMING